MYRSLMMFTHSWNQTYTSISLFNHILLLLCWETGWSDQDREFDPVSFSTDDVAQEKKNKYISASIRQDVIY